MHIKLNNTLKINFRGGIQILIVVVMISHQLILTPEILDSILN
jgi:hypothetical protein